MKKILITGGAGYIGTCLIPILLSDGYKVTVYDSLEYGGEVLLPFFKYKNFSFVKGNIMNKEKITKEIAKHDAVVHLAAIVGLHACEERPELTRLVNIDGTKSILDALSKDQYLFYGSTGSNYGIVDGVCTEETPLRPKTLYAETKTLAEEMCMQRENSTSFRFATAFGASPRLRLDLLVNDLTYLAKTQGYIMVYQPKAMRTFINVRDIAKCFSFSIENLDKMTGEVYNIGSNKLNHSKEEVVELIRSKTGCAVEYKNFDYDKDYRDYEVSYDKISKLNFTVDNNIEDGIGELLNSFECVSTKSKRFFNVGE